MVEHSEIQPAGSVAASVSRALVHMHKEFYGKGPVRAKTYLVNDTVICMLAGGFTTVEQTLISDGKAEEVEQIRRSFQRTMEHKFRASIEELTGRQVIAYMSQVHTSPDLAVELFVLEPRAEMFADEHEGDFWVEEFPDEPEGPGSDSTP